jgi:general secretion pathway protein L
MSRLLGIDATKTTVRAAVVRTAYRKVMLEAFGEADIAWAGSEAEAIRLAAGGRPSVEGDPLATAAGRAAAGHRPDGCALSLSGEKSFYRRLDLPIAAQKDLENVLAFELEATVPFEMDEAVFDHRTLRGTPGSSTVPVFAVLGRTEDVRARIAVAREALGIEPERVGSGPLPLANLLSVIPELEKPARPGPFAILDVAEQTTEIVIILGGEAVFARTLSRGTSGLPESAHALARDLRQTLGGWRSQGGTPLNAAYLVGVGASAPGASEFLATELGVNILPLPRPRLDGLTEAQAAELPRFAKALGLALGLAGRARVHNLRRGALEAERSYPYLREKIPVLSGLAAVIAVSFGFSTIAELRSLDAEREMLGARLAAVTRDVFGEEISEPDKAREHLESGPGKADEDPMPHIDGFDVMVQLSKAVPKDMVHDVVELDAQRSKVVLQGVVPAVADSDTIAKAMRENRCFKDVKVARTTQYGEGKYKYQLELELKCEDRKPKPKPAAEAASSSAEPAAASAKPDQKEGNK